MSHGSDKLCILSKQNHEPKRVRNSRKRSKVTHTKFVIHNITKLASGIVGGKNKKTTKHPSTE